MFSFLKIFKEQIQHFALAKRIGDFETKNKNSSNYLGSLWDIFTPLLQIAIYWFVFTSIMQKSDITLSNGESIPYIYWLIIGYVVWIFCFKSIVDSSSSVYSRINVLSKVEFPLAAVPLIPILKQFKMHIKLFVVSWIIILIAGFLPTLYTLQLLFIVPFMVFFFVGLGLFTSTISTIVRDFHQLLSAVSKMFLYISPVLWQVSVIGGSIGEILKYNPIHYFIEVYRASLFGTEFYIYNNMNETIVVGLIVIFIYLIGSFLHNKFRKNFVDYA